MLIHEAYLGSAFVSSSSQISPWGLAHEERVNTSQGRGLAPSGLDLEVAWFGLDECHD